MDAYDFVAPRRIVFGWGRRAEIGPAVRGLGRRALLVCGSKTLERAGAIDEIIAHLAAEGIATVRVAEIHREPLVEDVDTALERVRAVAGGAKPGDFVLGLGGGSAIDLAKAVAALATQAPAGSVLEYLEGVGTGRTLVAPPLPVVAMPTTGGTGSEATKNAVISSHDPAFKKSLRSEALVPSVVLVDPELAVGVPAETTAATGMDAITQCIESYITRRRRPIAQSLAADGLRQALPALPRAVASGSDRAAREAMAHAALLSGMALANSGLGFAHGVAAALGVTANVPHGLACAVMLPAALKVNFEASRADLAALARLAAVSDTTDDAMAAQALVERVEALCRQLSIPMQLRDLGVAREQLPEIAAGSRGNSMSGNPVQLADDELLAVLENMW